MKYGYITALLVFFVIESASAVAGMPSGSAYLEGGSSKAALILIHGRGKHPTWKVVDPLRKGVNKALEFHTLSLQVPNEDKKWQKYAVDFPRAYEIISAGIQYLRDEKGVTSIYLMGHSMGSRMASAFVAEHSGLKLSGLIIAGCRNNGGYPLSCDKTIRKVNTPVLDIWGGSDTKDTDAASDRREFVSANYEQKEIPGANHKFDGHDDELVAAVVAWLKFKNQSLAGTSAKLGSVSVLP